jgi:hypothetical protein
MTADPALTPAEAQQAYVDRFAQLTPRNPPTREPGERPRAMLLGGQPAAGKSTTQRLVHLALGEDRVASYDGDDNAAVHPRFDAIMREQGTEAFNVIYNALPEDLHGKSLDHLRAGDPKYDVVASHPLTREEWAKAWVEGFNQNDYRVSVAYIATNDANSMLGLVDQYQGARDNEGGGRWLDLDLHDIFYRETLATAQALESEGLVDDIYVVNRDGYVSYENHRDADGNWEHEPGVGQAIQDERDRPPTRKHGSTSTVRLTVCLTAGTLRCRRWRTRFAKPSKRPYAASTPGRHHSPTPGASGPPTGSTSASTSPPTKRAERSKRPRELQRVRQSARRQVSTRTLGTPSG